MNKVRVMTIVGTRPEIIRLSRVVSVLDAETQHILVHTGQNFDYELNEIFFKELGLRQPAYFLGAAGANAAETIGNVIIATDRVLEAEKPEAVLLLGDTNSCLAAIPAKRRKIPVFHMEAGNRCFDQRVPEEINRKIVDHISDINLPYSDIAREYLLREGLPPDRIIKLGSPMYEVLTYYREAIERSDVLEREGLSPGGFFLVSAHREENIEPEAMFRKLLALLKGLAETYRLPVVVSTHPRTRKRMEASGYTLPPAVRLLKPFGYFDYVRLQKEARLVLSDSGTITEESSILGFPALNIRETHERPEGMEEAAVIMTGLHLERIYQAIRVLEADAGRAGPGRHRMVRDYDVPNVSEKVLRVILSYIDYVHRTVWQNGPAATAEAD